MAPRSAWSSPQRDAACTEMSAAIPVRAQTRPKATPIVHIRAKRQLVKRLLTAALIVIALVALVQLVQARRHLSNAVADLNIARSVAGNLTALQDPTMRQQLNSHLSAANGEFGLAENDLVLWEPLLGHLGWVPGVGSELAAAAPLATAGRDSTSAALSLLDASSPMWSILAAHRPGQPLLPRILPVLARGHLRFMTATREFDSALAALRGAPVNLGSAVLNRSLHRFRGELPGLRNSAEWLTAAPTLLGWSRPSHILLAWEDRRELRSTGGFIGAVNYMTVRKGIVSTQPSGSALSHEITMPIPAPMATYTDEVSWLFRDSNWSPSFPLSARFERWLYGEDTGRWAPMVVNVTDGAADILQATGPVYVPGYRRVVAAKNAQAVANFYIYGTRHPFSTSQARADASKTSFLGVFMGVMIKRLQGMGIPGFLRVATGLHRAVAQEHLLMYDRNPAIERTIVDVGAEGTIARPQHDFLYIVDDNRSYNKLNPYVREAVTYHVVVRPDLWAQATLTLRYHVNRSPNTLEGFGPHFGLGGTKHDYLDFLRIYVPPGARLLGSSGIDAWADETAYGARQLAGGMGVKENHTDVVVFRYLVPPSAFTGNRYQLTIQRQPGSYLGTIHLEVLGTGGVTIGGKGGVKLTVPVTQRLNRVSVPVGGPIHPASYSPPHHVYEGDPYILPSLFTDKRHPL